MNKCSQGNKDVYTKCVSKQDSLYITESVGDMIFYKCKQCPFMTLAEKDIESHWYSSHSPLPIRCPGCNNFFETENLIKVHLKDHHKMGATDINKLVEKIVRIARRNPGDKADVPVPAENNKPADWETTENKEIPAVIEIAPDISACNINDSNITIITEQELQNLGCYEFEKMSQADVKHIIKEASINILYSDASVEQRNLDESNPASPQRALETARTVLNAPLTSKPNLNTYITINPDLQTKTIILNKPTCSDNSDELLNKSFNMETFNNSKIFETPFKSAVNHMHNSKSTYDNSDISSNSETFDDEKLCTYPNCTVKLRSNEKLNYHIKCHQNGKLCCPECRRFFIYIERFHTHLWKSHNIDMELYSCDICSYKFFNNSRLIDNHQKTHRKKLKTKNKQIPKNKPRKYVCELCQRSYSFQVNLREHMACVHAKLKPFECDQCHYSFARKSALKLHKRSHYAEKLFACCDCDFKTGDHNSLRRHKKRHTQDMTYKCQYCAYSCIQAHRYKTHIKSKHPGVEVDNYYSCPYCQYKSVNRLNFVTHLSTHNNQEEVPLLIKMTMSRILNGWVPSNQEEKANDGPNILTKTHTNTDCIDIKGKPNQTSNSIHVNVNTTKVPIEFDDSETNTEIPYKLPKIRNNENTHSCLNNNNGNFDTLQNFISMEMDFNQEDNNSDCVLLEGCEEPRLNDIHSQNANMISAFFAVSSKSNDISEPVQKSSLNIIPQMFTTSSTDIPIMSIPPPLLPMNDQSNISSSSDTINTIDDTQNPSIKTIGLHGKSMIPTTLSFQNQNINPSFTPRKESNISVKSNLILKGPDEVNIFHSQQKMAFKRLEDNQQRINVTAPAESDFVNLGSLYANDQPESNNLIIFSNDTLSGLSADLASVQDKLVRGSPSDNLKMFNIDANKTILTNSGVRCAGVNSPGLLSNNSQNIKMETKQSLSFMNYLNNSDEVRLVATEELLTDYGKASHRLDNISKKNLIKNENMADIFANNVNLGNINMVNCLQTIDASLVESLPGFNVNYSHNGNADYMVLPENADDPAAESNDFQADVIEIDDTSNDMKLLPNMNLALSMDYINSVCDMNLPSGFIQHFNESEGSNNVQVKEKPRIISEVYISGDKTKSFNFGNLGVPNVDIDQPVNFMHGVNDPMMNSSVRPAGSKLSVKNIETMINTSHSRE